MSFDTLKYALEFVSVDGMYLEFGVNYGQSIHFIATLTDGPVHGFDSFEGLPEDWGPEKRGTYSTYGVLPDVPANVVLHKGWFSDTLPEFLLGNDQKLAFANIDCDLYSSTNDVFNCLSDRVTKGSVLVFDEYLVNENWRDHEFKSFQEFVARTGIDYQYLAFGPFSKQAAVRII